MCLTENEGIKVCEMCGFTYGEEFRSVLEN